MVAGWSTPRGPLGGYVMAIVMRGLELAVDDPERQARSVTMHFLRPPAAGPVAVSAAVERSGPLADERQRPARAGRQAARPRARRLLEALGGAAPRRVADARWSAARRLDAGRRAAPSDRIPPEFTERMVMQHRFGDPSFTRRRPRRDRRLARAARGAPDRRARGGGAGRRLVPRPLAAAERARPGPDDRPHRALPLAAARRRARSCSAASTAATCATASSRRTACSGRPTARSWRSRASSGC